MVGPLVRPVDWHGRLGAVGAALLCPDARLSAGAVREALIRRATAAGLSPARAMRYIKPGAQAVADVTELLQPPHRRG